MAETILVSNDEWFVTHYDYVPDPVALGLTNKDRAYFLYQHDVDSMSVADQILSGNMAWSYDPESWNPLARDRITEWRGVMIKRRKPPTVDATAELAKLDREDAELGEKLKYAGMSGSGITLAEFERLNSVVGIWNGRFTEHNPDSVAEVWRADVRACNSWNAWADAHDVPTGRLTMNGLVQRVRNSHLPGFHQSWYTRS